MGGSKASSTSEVGNGLPRCGCNETMKLLVSKSIENPGRKFWKCRNYMVSNFEAFYYFEFDFEINCWWCLSQIAEWVRFIFVG
jgi:hypothetical protein